MGLAVDLSLENALAPIVFIELLFGLSVLKLWIDHPNRWFLGIITSRRDGVKRAFAAYDIPRIRCLISGRKATVQNKFVRVANAG